MKFFEKRKALLKQLQDLENLRGRALDKTDELFPVDEIHWIASPGLHVGIDLEDGSRVYLVRIS